MLRRAHGPVCGLIAEVEQAESDLLAPEEVALLLVAMRSGDGSAEAALVTGLRAFIYRAARNERYPTQHSQGYRGDWLGILYIALVRAIGQLRNNSEMDAELHIRKELVRAIRRYYREVSVNILPPASTNRYRRERELPEYPALKRQHKIERDHRWVDPLTDDETLERVGYIQRPSQIVEQAEQIEAIATTPLERNVIGLIKAGFSERDISQSLGISRHQVRRIIGVLQLRARPLAA